eukprot:TRINITY_DN6421_c0_g1_i24.p1 TRINITY_DN6421_c0_g1~~TRINITY_DN6421_c0_g1_i24.p1  ORF type:complete len:171 (-),score=21.51 TRINITY_DN6421_c0_g1_i24:56-568(-)
MLLSCSYDDTVKVWLANSEDFYLSQTLTGHSSTVWDMAFSPSGDMLVTVGEDKTMILWQYTMRNGSDDGKQIPHWQPVQSISGHHVRSIYAVDWSKSNIIVTGCADNSLRFFVQDENSNQFRLHYTQEDAHASDVNSVAWNPRDPSLLVTSGDDERIKFWDVQGLLPIRD